MKLSVTVEGEEQLKIALGKASDVISDLRPAWKPAQKLFQDFSEDQFQSSGSAGASGKWKPLSKKYEAQKVRKFGTFALLAGINIRTERLYKSLRGETSDTVYIPEKDSLTLGTTVPYAGYVQRVRPVISLSDKQKQELGMTIKKELKTQMRGTGLTVNESNFGSIG